MGIEDRFTASGIQSMIFERQKETYGQSHIRACRERPERNQARRQVADFRTLLVSRSIVRSQTTGQALTEVQAMTVRVA